MLGDRARSCLTCQQARFNREPTLDEHGNLFEGEEGFRQARRRGLTKCDKPSGCTNPMPKLDRNSARVLDLFLRLHGVMGASDFTGAHKCVPRADLEVEARIRGYDLSEFDLDKIAICERTLIDRDQEELRRQRDSSNSRRAHNNYY